MEDIKQAIIKLLKKETQLENIELESPPNPEMGDFAFPCFPLASTLKKAPNEIAEELAEKLEPPKGVERIQATGPYLNFFITSSDLAENICKQILKEKEKFGKLKTKKETVMVEFFHANTHKGIHIGHLRNISLGESLSRILEAAGKKVIRVNYQGDIGPHVAKCLWGYLKNKKKEPKTQRGTWLGHIYTQAHQATKKSKKAEQEVKEINKKLYAKDKEFLELWKKTRKWCLDDFEDLYKEFGVKFNRLYFESEADPLGKEEVQKALKKNIAKESDGAIIFDFEEDNLGIYVAITGDGTPTYQTKELGLALLKQKEYKFDKSVHVVGSEQELFFRQVFKTYELMKSPMARISKHLAYGLVMLPEGKMSSREGTMVLYDDLLEKIKAAAEKEIKRRHKKLSKKEIEKRAATISFGALKYGMIARENQKTLVFDWDQALAFEGNTGPYIQYAHARCNSIIQKAESKLPKDIHYELLTTEEEKALLKLLATFEERIEAAANYKPYLLAHYLYDLAQSFNNFYHKHQVNSENPDLSNARLALVAAIQQVLANGLQLLGIEAPQEM